MLLLFWREFGSLIDHQKAVYETVEYSYNERQYATTDPPGSTVSYTVGRVPSGVEYRHEQEV